MESAMPAGYQKWPPKFTDRPCTLARAAEHDQVVVVRCNGCRRTTYYLPADLAALYGERRAAYDALHRPRTAMKIAPIAREIEGHQVRFGRITGGGAGNNSIYAGSSQMWRLPLGR
jgi:hypothetical protein